MSISRAFQENVLAVQRQWHYLDGKDVLIGRAASIIAPLLQGKHKPIYSPSHDVGDHVVVVNANHLELSGKKWKNNPIRWHTGYIGNMQTKSALEIYNDRGGASRLLTKAVLGMLPKNRLQKERIARLHIYPKEEHPHSTQLQQFPGAIINNAYDARKLEFAEEQQKRKIPVDTKYKLEVVDGELRYVTEPMTREEILIENAHIKNLEKKLKSRLPKIRHVGRPGRFTPTRDSPILNEEELQTVNNFIFKDPKNPPSDEQVQAFIAELIASRPLDWVFYKKETYFDIIKKKQQQQES